MERAGTCVETEQVNDTSGRADLEHSPNCVCSIADLLSQLFHHAGDDLLRA